MSTVENEITAPAAIISSNDNKGLVAVITALFLSFAVVFLYVRLHLRLRRSGLSWKQDDNFTLGATLLCIAQSSVVFYALSAGYGKSIDLLTTQNLEQIGKAVFAADMLYISTLFFSKIATLFLYIRISPGRASSLACWITIGASAVWAVLALLIITIRCSPAHPWVDLEAQCSDYFVRWQVIAALDMVTDAIIFLISLSIVAGLQMPLKFKALVVTAFASRLPIIALSGIRLHFLGIEITSDNPTLDAAATACATQIGMDYSVMANTISCLGPFLSPFTKENAGYSSERSRHVRLRSMPSSSQNNEKEMESQWTTKNTSEQQPVITLRKDGVEHTVAVTHEATSERPSIGSDESQRNMIVKKTDIFVHKDTRSPDG